ncbi:hypothetical protein ILUMI_02738 [Ignelater luminosus]|uniref:Uncharacterized protein n=1 Tax=Ignelater luminosus TaxID=2038154 RepID=A0A8K0GG69_IGNLU|nr:hypothetical protein ILUMI_02738 [Ignelater luminosus]
MVVVCLVKSKILLKSIMKPVLLIGLALVAAVSAGPLNEIPILRYESEGPNPDGSYRWNYETGNGIAAQEQGGLKNPDTLEAQGSYQYTSPEGIPIAIVYLANENGFQAQGDAIPVPPPIPPAIQRALEWNAAHPEEEEPHRQQYAATNPQPAYKPLNAQQPFKPFKK